MEQLDFSISAREVYIDRKFLDRPADLPLVGEIQSLFQKWLKGLGVNKPIAKVMLIVCPSYLFTHLIRIGGASKDLTEEIGRFVRDE